MDVDGAFANCLQFMMLFLRAPHHFRGANMEAIPDCSTAHKGLAPRHFYRGWAKTDSSQIGARFLALFATP